MYDKFGEACGFILLAPICLIAIVGIWVVINKPRWWRILTGVNCDMSPNGLCGYNGGVKYCAHCGRYPK